VTTLFRPEHPRPTLKREPWLNLNGQWRFAFDPELIGEQERWYLAHTRRARKPVAGLRGEPMMLTINVPYPWESLLSGVARPAYKGAAWYEREFTVPAEWHGLQPYLIFGAADWQARVWLNGRLVAEHDNGYLPFAIDLSPYLQPGETATLTVRAFDVADAATLLGKQVPAWYTHSSGLWQTVWLEGRAATHLEAVRIEPDLKQAQATVKLRLRVAEAGRYQLRVAALDEAFPAVEISAELAAGQQALSLTVPVPEPRLWSPESPHLYELAVEVKPAGNSPTDRVTTYFGMRQIGRGSWAGNAYEVILLNGEPIYLRGALDQAFHPDSLHAYPSDEVIRGDIELAKAVGLNMLRCHIKINDPRYYYWADRLGLLIMYDFPSPDLDSPTMRRIFEETLPRVIERDFNCPSIFAWVLFNETWGLTKHDTAEARQWLQQLYHRAKTLDPTRLVEENSVCRFDHVESDINSWHFYINDYWQVRQHIQRVVDETYPGSSFNYVGGDYLQGTAPLLNSEYGGISARLGDQDIAWCFKYQTSELRRHAKICGYVYTELDDIEWEHNGLVNYDHSAKEFGYDFFAPGMGLADLNSADFVGLDLPPAQTLPPAAEFQAPIFVSQWGPPFGRGQVQWFLTFIDRFGQRQTLQEGQIPVQPSRFSVTRLEPLPLSLPAENGLASLIVHLVDQAGQVRCRNYVNIEVRQEKVPHVEATATGWAIRFEPGHIHRTSWVWPRPFIDPSGAKFSAQGSGWVEYTLSLPPAIDPQTIRRLRLRFEAGARAGLAKVDWPQQLNGFNYPQTEAQTFPSDLTVSLNGVVIGQLRLPDDPADARGVLSHHHQVDPGAYGYLTELIIEGETLAAILPGLSAQPAQLIRFTIAPEAEYAGGLALYGETRGCYPLGPTLLVDLAGSKNK
jgi:hypothetical protein